MPRGGLLAGGSCYICGEWFTFNPELVPSIEGKPICEPCMEVVNREREVEGLPPVHIYPNSYGLMEI